VPRAPWRRRRTTDSPRPAGRRWAGRLRRSGSLARQVLLVGRRGRPRSEAGAIGATELVPEQSGDTDGHSPTRFGQRVRLRRAGTNRPDTSRLAPVSPVVPAPPGTGPLSIPLLPGERTLARQLRFAVVNGCTIASLILGMSAIFIAINHGEVRFAALCLIACVVFDGLDGGLARRFGVASPFGAQMDSLADMCSFGIAAPVVMFAWLAGSAPAALVVAACALVAVCAAIRLARFNVSPKDGRYFCGVPTTMVAAVLALGTLISPAMPAGVRVAAVAVLALAMVSGFPYAKLARLLRLPPWVFVVPVVGAMIDFRVTFVAVVLTYLASGPLIWLRQRTTA
jgi:CDP-diacylglycerol--serine O-phosphatidyltransferase